MFKYLIPITLAASCSHSPSFEKKVTLIKQWNLSPKVVTLDVKTSVNLPQYKNQADIYKKLLEFLKASQDNLTLIAEGCEAGTVIDENFTSTYNGWNYASLKFHADKPHYDEVLTFLPLKIKSKYPERVHSLCGDNENLAKKSRLAIDEARGYIAFYYRLEQGQHNPHQYASYLKALEETEGKKIDNPLQYTEKRALENVANFWKIMKERNSYLVKTVKENLDKSPIIIVGGFHVRDLEGQLSEEGIEVEIITPRGYPLASEDLGEQLTKYLKKSNYSGP